MTSEEECKEINRNEIVSADSGFSEADNSNDVSKLTLNLNAIIGLEKETNLSTPTEEDDESVEQKKMTVTNLKPLFEQLPGISPVLKEKPNWWIKVRNEEEYISYSKDRTHRKRNKTWNFVTPTDADSDKTVDKNTIHHDKIPTGTDGDLHLFSSSDSSGSDEEEVAEEENESSVTNESKEYKRFLSVPEIFGKIDLPDRTSKTSVEEGKEADEEVPERDNLSLISFLSNNSSNNTGLMTNVEALPEKNQRQLINVIQELIQTETNYVNNLKKGVEIYVKVIDVKAVKYPELLGKKYHVFGNIERLYYFHKDELLPSLIACNEDVMRIADLFYTFITKDYFYGYVLFGINKPRAERLTIKYKDFFQEITKESNDRLGVNSFLLQPIQILPRYKLLFGEVIKALANDIEGIKNVKDVISACCIAEKQIQRLLDTVNEALSLNDIEETYEQPTSIFNLNYAIFGVVTDLGTPVPTEDCLELRLCLKYGNFDLLDHGKFKKMSVFTMFDIELDNKKYKGKAFLFEYTLLCTEFMEKSNNLQYRAHINVEDIEFIETDNKEGFRIITTNNRNIDFFADFLKVQEWIKALTSIDGKGGTRHNVIKVRNCSLVSRSTSVSSRTHTESNRSTFARSKAISNTMRVTRREKQLDPPRVEKVFSNASSISNRSSSSSQDSYDLGNTTWDERKYLESLRNIEKHYIFLLHIHKKGYLDVIPFETYAKLKEFIEVYDAILDYHSKHIRPVIETNGMDITFVCNLFSNCIKDPNFMIYNKYAVLAPPAFDILSLHYLNSLSQPGEHLDEFDRGSLQTLDYFVEIPLRHLRKYKMIFNKMVKMLMDGIENQKDYSMELMRMVAVVQVEIGVFEKQVRDNFKIHSKRSYSIKARELGMILYSDLVIMEYSDTPRHKLFLMETVVLAVRIRIDPKDEDNEIFEAFIWSLPYEMLDYRHSVKIDERIKIFSKLAKFQQYSVIFRSGERKKEFLKRLDSILNTLSGFKTFLNE